MMYEETWKQTKLLALYLTKHEARLLAAAIRVGQNKLADEVKQILAPKR